MSTDPTRFILNSFALVARFISPQKGFCKQRACFCFPAFLTFTTVRLAHFRCTRANCLLLALVWSEKAFVIFFFFFYHASNRLKVKSWALLRLRSGRLSLHRLIVFYLLPLCQNLKDDTLTYRFSASVRCAFEQTCCNSLCKRALVMWIIPMLCSITSPLLLYSCKFDSVTPPPPINSLSSHSMSLSLMLTPNQRMIKHLILKIKIFSPNVESIAI